MTRFPPGQRRGLTEGHDAVDGGTLEGQTMPGFAATACRVGCKITHPAPPGPHGSVTRRTEVIDLSVGRIRPVSGPIVGRHVERRGDCEEDAARKEERRLLTRDAGRLAHGL